MIHPPRFRVVVCAISLLLAFWTSRVIGQDTLRHDHNRFYRVGSIIDVGKVVGLDKVAEGRVVTVTIGYNMTRSELEVEWICEDEVLAHSKLDQGIDKRVSYDFNRPLPASIQARFTGTEGQIQVKWASAVTAPLDPGVASIVRGVPTPKGEITGFEGPGGETAVAAAPTPSTIDDNSLLTPVEIAPFVARVEIEPSIIRPGSTAIGRVLLGVKARSGGFVVPLEVYGPKASAVHVPPEVTVEDGRSEIEFEIETDPAGDDEALVGRTGCLFTIVAERGLRGSGPPQQSAKVLQPELESLRFDPRHEIGAGGTVQLRLTLAEPASPGGTVVMLHAVGPPDEVAQVPERLRISEGETGASLPIAIGARSSGYFTVEGRTSIMKLNDRLDIRFGVPISSVRLEPPDLRPGTTVDLVVDLAEQAMLGGATISLDVSGEGETMVDVPSEIHIEEGETRGSFGIAIEELPGGQLASELMADPYARQVVFEVSTPVITKGQPIPNTRTAQGLITQAEIEDLRFAETVVPAGQSAVATISLEEPAGPGGTFVWLTLSGFAADYATAPEEIRFADGETARDVEVPIDLAASDKIYSGFTVDLEARSNDRIIRRGVQLDYPTWIKSLEVDPRVIRIGETFTFTVTMSDPVPWDDFWVGIRAAEEGWNPNSSPGSPTLKCVRGDGPATFTKGQTTVTMEMETPTWCEYEGPINIWAMAQRLGHLRVSAPAELVRLPKIERFEVSGAEAVLPGSTVHFDLYLTKHAPAGGVRIKLSPVESSVRAKWPEEITINEGVRGATFEINLAPDNTGSFAIRAEIFAGDIVWSSAMESIAVGLQ